MRYVLTALALWFGLEFVFMAILVLVSAIEGHRAKREPVVDRLRFLPGSETDREHHHRASA